MTDKIGEFARSYWPVIAALLMIAAAWGTSTAQIGWLDASVKGIGTKLDTMSLDVATIKATGHYTTQEIADLRERVREIERRR